MTQIKDAIPTETHGFSVSMELGPYPLGSHDSHRTALYCWMRPITQANIAKLQWKNSSAIVGTLPLTAEQVVDIQQDPNSPKVEPLHVAAYRVALKQAKAVAAEV
jgi:hypothetical protein